MVSMLWRYFVTFSGIVAESKGRKCKCKAKPVRSYLSIILSFDLYICILDRFVELMWRWFRKIRFICMWVWLVHICMSKLWSSL